MDKLLTRRPITARQREVYDAILAHWSAHGAAPSLREVAEAIGVAGVAGAVCHLAALHKAGWLEREDHTARSLWPAGLRDRVKAAAAALAREGDQ